MSYTIVTTFHGPGYQEYAKRMLQTWKATWPQEVQMLVYAEDCSVEETAPNLVVMDSHSTLPALVAFKQKWSTVPLAIGQYPLGPADHKGKQPGIGFKWDAVRFANKIYAVCHAAQIADSDWLIWLDADSVCHSPITQTDLARLCPPTKDLCYLGRAGKYSECGLYAMNLRSRNVHLFLKRFQAMYDHAENGIFKQSEWHDSYIWDAVKASIPELKLLNWSEGLIQGEGHPLINSEWGKYLDHLKGKRKTYGRSHPGDLKTRRTESYWQ